LDKSLKIGHSITRLKSVDSTNNYVAMLYNDGKINHGCVIMAEEQTRGRGQRDNKWISNPNENILISICIEPINFLVEKQFDITCFTSIAISNYLNELGIKAEIKWPNDIMVNEKKIAGILIENQLKGNLIKFSNIGIGINVNQLNFNELKSTSIIKELNKKIPINKHLSLLLNSLNKTYESLFYFDNKIRNRYLSNLYQFNVLKKYKANNKLFYGKIIGVSKWGKLLIESQSKTLEFDNKEIKFI